MDGMEMLKGSSTQKLRGTVEFMYAYITDPNEVTVDDILNAYHDEYPDVSKASILNTLHTNLKLVGSTVAGRSSEVKQRVKAAMDKMIADKQQKAINNLIAGGFSKEKAEQHVRQYGVA